MTRTIYFNKTNEKRLKDQTEPWSRVVNKALEMYFAANKADSTDGEDYEMAIDLY